METTAKINGLIQLARGITKLNLANLSTRDGWVLTIEGEDYGSPKPLTKYEAFLGDFVTWVIVGAKAIPVAY
jgi:hypothetical protein